ncbi:MAG: histidinol-phosphate transaminase [Gammaproteobacteria bacterium]
MPSNPHIFAIRPYQPGKPIEEVEREYGLHSVIKLASNENALGPSPKALLAAQKALTRSALYPDSTAFTLVQKLAEKHKLPEDHFVMGTGSDHVFMLLALVLLNPAVNAVISEYTFPTYAIATHSVGAELRIARAGPGLGHSVDHLLAAVDPSTRVVFVDNPNNPVGSYLPGGEVERLLRSLSPDVTLVLDEAYFEFANAPDYVSGLEYVGRYPNLIVTRTFSKAYGLAGFRIGYGVTQPALVDLLKRVRLPFSLSHVALAAAEAALSDHAHLNKTRALIETERPLLAQNLARMLPQVLPGAGNFISARTPMPAQDLFVMLLKRGIIIRPLGAMGLPDFIRITVGLPDENQALLKALSDILG